MELQRAEGFRHTALTHQLLVTLLLLVLEKQKKTAFPSPYSKGISDVLCCLALGGVAKVKAKGRAAGWPPAAREGSADRRPRVVRRTGAGLAVDPSG